MLFCVVHTKRRAGREFSFFFFGPIEAELPYRTLAQYDVRWYTIAYGMPARANPSSYSGQERE